MCSTCVAALNRLGMKILPVVNAATCAKVHVQIVFRSIIVRSSGEFHCRVSLLRRSTGCLLIPCTRVRLAWLPFFVGWDCVSCALAGHRSPVAAFLVPLQAARRSCPMPMLKSVSCVRGQIWRHAGHDGEVFLWPFGQHRDKK